MLLLIKSGKSRFYTCSSYLIELLEKIYGILSSSSWWTWSFWFSQQVHLQNSPQFIFFAKHSQYFFKQPDFLHLQPCFYINYNK